MKIRNGFVSNSSTSSFVICLDRSYNFPEKEIEHIKKFFDELTDEQFKKDFDEAFESLCSKGLWFFGDDIDEGLSEIGSIMVWSLFMNKSPAAISKAQMDSGGWNCVHNLLADDMKNKIRKVDLNENT